MLRSVTDLTGYSIHAIDGGIGKVEDCLFDDDKWTIRYFIVHTGGWLLGRNVLISPIAVKEIAWEGRYINVNLTRVQVENSPDIDLEEPISRALEAKYFRYYSWPYYWTGAGIWGTTGVPDPVTQLPEAPYESDQQDLIDQHLRSSRESLGYRIEALDAHFGHLSDLLFDDKNWSIRYLAVQTRNWVPGKSVLIEPEHVELLDWTNRRLHIDLTEQAIKNARKYTA